MTEDEEGNLVNEYKFTSVCGGFVGYTRRGFVDTLIFFLIFFDKIK